MKRLLMLAATIIPLFLCAYNSSAQEQVLRGKVVSKKDSSPLAGATIKVKGSSVSVAADNNGFYSLTVPNASGTLVVSYIGHVSQEVPINNQSEINILLEPNETSKENEVVVVAYGTQRRRDVTGSVASVTANELKALPIASIEQGLQGRMPGVQVIQGNASPGGAINIRIRGGNSMLGGNEPLYVIDGFPLYNSTSSDVSNQQVSNPLASINPNDIVSVEVLKDASATAIYGSRGANGVVIITTKRGKAGQGSVEFETYYGVQQILRKIPMLNAREYAELANEKAINIGRPQGPYFPDLNNLPGNVDWQDQILQKAPIQNYNITFSGGSEASRYSVSGNYFDQEGIVRNSGFKRGSVRVNLDNRLSSRFTLATSITGSSTENDRARNSIFFGNGVVHTALTTPPVAPVYKPDGTLYRIGDLPTTDPASNNAEAMITGVTNKETLRRFLGNTNLSYRIFNGLNFSVRLGLDFIDGTTDYYVKRILTGSGEARITKSESLNFLNENILNYKKNFGLLHSIDVTGGFTWQEQKNAVVGAGSNNYVLDIFGTNNLGAGSVITAPLSDRSKNTLISYLGRINYSFKDRYLFTVSGRADGSSRFGIGNKWGYFPSAALGWRVSEEAFMKNIRAISEFKIRTSYGLTGNQEIGNYQSVSRLSNVPAVFGQTQTGATGFAPTALENPDLKWETTTQFDIGADLGFFEDRVRVTIDYYQKHTKDLLASVPLAASSGYRNILLNFGELDNRGVEVGINSTVFNTKNLRWDVGMNYSRNRNKVIDVASASGEFLAPDLSSPLSASVNIIREGFPVSAFYGLKTNGLWDKDQTAGSIQPTAKAGDQRYVDINHDGIINNSDRVILGDPNPDFIYGLNSNLTFQNFDFSFFIQGVQGGMVFNANKYLIGDNFARNSNQLAETKDRWTLANPNINAKYPRMSNVGPLVSDRFFEDASYFRLRNISLGYNIPFGKLFNASFIRSARIYISAQNLINITNYTGYDPEVSSTAGSDLRKGVDVGAYPSSRSYLIGFKLGL